MKKSDVRETRRVHFIVMNFIRIFLVLAFVGAYYNERWLVLFVAGLAFVITFLPYLLERRWGITIPAEFEIMVILFIYGSLFFGEVRGFYSMFWWWDVLLNLGAAIALGFVGLTVLFVLYKDEKLDASPLIIAVFAFCFSVAAGTLWEIFEFILDQSFDFALQTSALDTMSDVAVNALGALIVSVGGYYYIKSGKTNLVSSFIMKFVDKNPRLFRSKKKNVIEKETLKLAKKGEGEKLEFKSTLRTNLHTKDADKKIEHANLKTIVAFLNSNGGTLLIGVGDSGKMLGLQKEGFINRDKFVLHLTNLIKKKIGNQYLPFIKYEIIKVRGKEVFRVDCRRSDKPVFLKVDEGEEFFVRNGPSSVKLGGRELLDYVGNKFKDD
tara:strand:+ start:1309 stop:2451 length:1143 start_codon:yes stop_codon:yes gene_type:complete